VAFLIVLKTLAYLDNGSVSVLASLLDSVVDAGASIITFMAIRFSLKPADSEHRHGHGKIEGLAAFMQAGLIAGAGFFLLLESFYRFKGAPPPGDLSLAIPVMIVSVFISGLLIAVQKYSLRHAPSLAVESDYAHYANDIIVNGGVIAVLWLQSMGAPVWVDPVFGIVIAIYLGFSSFTITRKALDMLLDRELPDDIREKITQIVFAHPKVLGMHDLRTYKSGMRVFMSFDVELDPSLLLYTAHEIVREVEHDLLLSFPNAEILIHADPYGDTFDTRHTLADVHNQKS
jgi:ferrous-iron efflux pump FieF